MCKCLYLQQQDIAKAFLHAPLRPFSAFSGKQGIGRTCVCVRLNVSSLTIACKLSILWPHIAFHLRFASNSRAPSIYKKIPNNNNTHYYNNNAFLITTDSLFNPQISIIATSVHILVHLMLAVAAFFIAIDATISLDCSLFTSPSTRHYHIAYLQRFKALALILH